jgi:SAM-dependent methyltransferase
MDFSPRSIDILNEKTRQEHIRNVEGLVWDLTQPFPLSEPVDKVLSSQVVQHIPTEHQRHQALGNMFDQLRDNGKAIIVLYNWRTLFTRGYFKDGYATGGYYYHRFTPAEAFDALQQCGFRNISIKGYANFGVYVRLGDRFSRLQHFVARCDEFSSRFNLSRYRGYLLILTASK